jgi:hypothetical protein
MERFCFADGGAPAFPSATADLCSTAAVAYAG